MKVKKILPLFFLFILLISCSNSGVTSKLFRDDHLKNETNNQRENIQWTMELEKNRLGEKISSINQVSSSQELNPQTFMALDAEYERFGIFPELDDFGSLDISDNDANAMAVLHNFFSSLKANQECDSYFTRDSIFSLVLFLHDIQDFDLTNAQLYFGKAFPLENALEIPVRIYGKNEMMDVKVYLKYILPEDFLKEFKEENLEDKNLEDEILETKISEDENSKTDNDFKNQNLEDRNLKDVVPETTIMQNNQTLIGSYKILDLEIAKLEKLYQE